MLKRFKKKKFNLEAFIAGSLDGLKLMNDAHRAAWRLGQEKSWRVNEKAGKIIFTFADGAEVSAPVQVIGTYHAKDCMFTWGWGHPSVARGLQQHAAGVKAFGEELAVEEMTTQQVPCTEQQAWEYTALAMLLAEANGAYRAQIAPDTYVFMTFGEVAVTAPA